jgi:hypothetical protein
LPDNLRGEKIRPDQFDAGVLRRALMREINALKIAHAVVLELCHPEAERSEAEG